MPTAADRWRDELAAWAIPPEILAAAPEPPWGFPVELFRADERAVDTLSRRRALEALPDGGSVLDVGCGGGVASFALVPPAARVTGVDSSPAMLEEYAATAARHGVAHDEVEGTWPDIADRVALHDVVVCHHVVYNVPDLAAFAAALTAHARHRVVVECTARHPLTATGPLWSHFHGIERPSGPTAELALAVLSDAGIHPQHELWQRPRRDVPRDVHVRLNRRRLCLPASADDEIDRVMGPDLLPRDVVTMWWDVT